MSGKQHPNNMEETTKLTNPKDMIGCDKLPLHLWPETATFVGCLGLLDGMLKYGRTNWRSAGIRASIYYDAVKRHIDAWFEGEDNDPDSGLPHMSHALACLAIIVDADVKGKLVDDRMFPTNYREFVTKMTPHVARLKKLHAHRTPKHYTIADKDDERLEARAEESRQEMAKEETEGVPSELGIKIVMPKNVPHHTMDEVFKMLEFMTVHPGFTKRFGEFNKKYTSKKK